MAVTGVHALVYTSEPEALRAVFREAFGWQHVDAGGGWLIFALPPAELAVHPAEQTGHELTVMCDDIEKTMLELQSHEIEFDGDPTDEGWGITVTMLLPGGTNMLLYEPRHETAIAAAADHRPTG